MKTIFIISITFAFALLACNNPINKNTTVADDNQQVITASKTIPINLDANTTGKLIIKGDSIRKIMQNAFQFELKNAIKNKGIEGAISFCNNHAMSITDSASIAEEVIIRRITLKNRNSNNSMNNQEKKIYNNYVISLNSNNPISPRINIDAHHHPVYYAPIIMKPICINCHGNLQKDINPNVAAKIKELYPNDKAVNFKVSDMRGMWAITFSKYYIN